MCKSERSVKGFTLVEMLVVIAIIVVLMGIMSLAIQGFQRNARVETNNAKAQMVYTAFQDIVTKCEIKQDCSLFDVDSTVSTPAHAGDPLIKSKLLFCMHGGQLTALKLYSQYDGSGWFDVDVPVPADRTNPVSESEKTFVNIEKSIIENLGSDFDGYAWVYVDCENYLVDSVICKEYGDGSLNVNSSTAPEPDDGLTTAFEVVGDEDYYKTINNIGESKNFAKIDGVYFGVYPYHDDVT